MGSEDSGAGLTDEPADALVIGGGPAGLMAAEALAEAGRRVTLAEKMPSLARKLLMAGKSGLNLTNVDGDPHRFGAAAARMAPMLDAFGTAETRAWAEALGQETFAGSSGRVFPRAMKASPLLRAWLARLSALGVEARTRWRWSHAPQADGPGPGPFAFDTPEGPRRLAPRVAVLALGGASWRRLGSDGAWTQALAARGVPLAPFAPANVGLRVGWSDHMARHYGAPLKNVRLDAGGTHARGEFVLSAHGLEGGALYPLIPAVRAGAPLTLDLMPDVAPEALAARLGRARRGDSLSARLRKLGLPPAAAALVHEWRGDLDLAAALKALPVRHEGPRPMDEAISVAGGVAWEGLDEGLMLRSWPGAFAAGEMLDWEAPTGGWLLTGCLSTGRWAGRAAARHAPAPPGSAPGVSRARAP